MEDTTNDFIVKEPQVEYAKKYFTEEEYLEMEEIALEKSEYYKGEIFAMAGAGFTHNMIFHNFYGNAVAHFKGKKCIPFGSDFRLHIPENTLYTYPDITIYCKQNETDTNLGNPTVIIEILSPSTQSYDKAEKFELYRDIKTLQEYITIDSQKVHVIRNFKNNNGNWEIMEFKNETDILHIVYVDFNISLQEIYNKVFSTTEY
jgi:Uma2 family endonuclease